MTEILIATQNQHKLHEISSIMGDLPVKLIGLNTLPQIPEIIEDGDSFSANAAIKARICRKLFDGPVVADDSGLEVAALNNAPGIYSARLGGIAGDYANNNRVLLEKMKDIPAGRRQAQFVCTICLIDNQGEHFFEGTSQGEILTELQGHEGFGYDPLFFVPLLNKTFAQLTLEEKNAISHRGRAFRKLKDFLAKHYFSSK